MATTKTELTEQAKRLREELSAMEAKIKAMPDEPVKPKSLLSKEKAVDASSVWNIRNHLAFDSCESYDQAEEYGAAFSTMIELRRQPGTVPTFTLSGINQAFIFPTSQGVSVQQFSTSKYGMISPGFENPAAAEAAIKALGEDRLLQMFKTLQGH